MTTTPDFRAELERLVDLYYALGGNWSPHGYTDTWNDALANARTALATLPPEPPTEEGGKKTILQQAAESAFQTLEGWENYGSWVWPVSALEQLHHSTKESLNLLHIALATPPPEPPTDEELLALQEKLWGKYKTIPYQGEEFMYGDAFESALSDYRAALERWGQR